MRVKIVMAAVSMFGALLFGGAGVGVAHASNDCHDSDGHFSTGCNH